MTANVIHQTQSAISALFLSMIHYLNDTAEFFASYQFNPLLLIRKGLKPDCSVQDDPKIKTQIFDQFSVLREADCSWLPEGNSKAMQ